MNTYSFSLISTINAAALGCTLVLFADWIVNIIHQPDPLVHFSFLLFYAFRLRFSAISLKNVQRSHFKAIAEISS